jgi:hypothetical protein
MAFWRERQKRGDAGHPAEPGDCVLQNHKCHLWQMAFVQSVARLRRVTCINRPPAELLYSLIAAIPGKTFPSKYSSNAPPPVDT